MWPNKTLNDLRQTFPINALTVVPRREVLLHEFEMRPSSASLTHFKCTPGCERRNKSLHQAGTFTNVTNHKGSGMVNQMKDRAHSILLLSLNKIAKQKGRQVALHLCKPDHTTHTFYSLFTNCLV